MSVRKPSNNTGMVRSDAGKFSFRSTGHDVMPIFDRQRSFPHLLWQGCRSWAMPICRVYTNLRKIAIS
ncbi:hypothetical protein [[Phormidium ambiguum] IAM M-71]|uniref:hypothetical protein n=1 Tax=[Phormidium ambiguum] IAM M-71 TaxID=454136 RepID=UPI001160F96D|nr:hypothetical protein [Phormidium ambiguum]